MVVCQFWGFINPMFAFVSNCRWFKNRERSKSGRPAVAGPNVCVCFCKFWHMEAVHKGALPILWILIPGLGRHEQYSSDSDQSCMKGTAQSVFLLKGDFGVGVWGYGPLSLPQAHTEVEHSSRFPAWLPQYTRCCILVNMILEKGQMFCKLH